MFLNTYSVIVIEEKATENLSVKVLLNILTT